MGRGKGKRRGTYAMRSNCSFFFCTLSVRIVTCCSKEAAFCCKDSVAPACCALFCVRVSGRVRCCTCVLFGCAWVQESEDEVGVRKGDEQAYSSCFNSSSCWLLMEESSASSPFTAPALALNSRICVCNASTSLKQTNNEDGALRWRTT